MSRSSRNDIASATGALCPVAFGTYLWLFFSYFASRPRHPHPELGLVYPLDNHGSYVYVSGPEATGLALLMLTFIAGLLVSVIIVPKDFIVPPPGTPRWLTYVSAAAKTDLAKPSRRLGVIFLCSLTLYLGVIFFAGGWVVDFLVARGVVLHFG